MEDISDLIQATVGPHFGFSKYAERIARTAVSFKPIQSELESPDGYLDSVLLKIAAQYFKDEPPMLLGFTVPFPGNLYGALKVSQWVKKNFPQTKIVLGGGYANTELRELNDHSVFDYVDFSIFGNHGAKYFCLFRVINLDNFLASCFPCVGAMQKRE